MVVESFSSVQKYWRLNKRLTIQMTFIKIHVESFNVVQKCWKKVCCYNLANDWQPIQPSLKCRWNISRVYKSVGENFRVIPQQMISNPNDLDREWCRYNLSIVYNNIEEKFVLTTHWMVTNFDDLEIDASGMSSLW